MRGTLARSAGRSSCGQWLNNHELDARGEWMRLIVVLGARLGAVLWGRAPILDPCHRRANLVCSQNVFDSRVAAFNRNCQLGAGRVRLWKRLCVRGAPSNSPCASALTWHRSAHVLLTCVSFAATGSWQLRVRRVRNGLAAAAYLREALDEPRLMSAICAHEYAALRAR